MIEKLDVLKNVVNCVDRNGITRVVSGPDCICAINDLIDVVNALVEENNTLKIPDPDKVECRNFDKFAEQRKWIGKLCRFWDDDEDNYFSKLVFIEKNSPYPYCASGDWWYKHCEPVKPDDDVIYKGE